VSSTHPIIPPGTEYLAPVAVCWKAQNGSVPRAKNGVTVVVTGVGITTPVLTMGGVVSPDPTGTTGVLGNCGVRVQPVMIMARADTTRGRRDRIKRKVKKILVYYMRMSSVVKSKIKT
jgi:hypothetical protein